MNRLVLRTNKIYICLYNNFLSSIQKIIIILFPPFFLFLRPIQRPYILLFEEKVYHQPDTTFVPLRVLVLGLGLKPHTLFRVSSLSSSILDAETNEGNFTLTHEICYLGCSWRFRGKIYAGTFVLCKCGYPRK